MNREFLEHYNRELGLFYEHAREFAEEFPGVAGRLGGQLSDRSDPMIGGLLEGAAFLAARVQLKLKSEYQTFTESLLEQVVPHYLAPTPSAMLVEVTPPYANPTLREGHTIAKGAYFDAVYRDRDRNVACRFQLRSAITLWPFQVTRADYISSLGALQAMGIPAGSDVVAALRLTLTCRSAERLEDEPSPADALQQNVGLVSGVRASRLPIYLAGAESDAGALVEQIFGHRRGVYLRHLDPDGDAVVQTLPSDCVEQVGFDEDERLLPETPRVFAGFDILRDYFIFPRKYLGFRLTGLENALRRVPAQSVDLVVTFDELQNRLVTAVKPELFRLHAAPAVNLFEKTLDRIRVRRGHFEYQIVADRSRALEYEAHRILDVFAHVVGSPTKLPVYGVYSAEPGADNTDLRYAIRRLPRRRTAEERRYAGSSEYVGVDTFIQFGGAAFEDDSNGVAEVSLRALCSNRHLVEFLPLAGGAADFRFLDDTSLDVRCVAGPSRPRESVVNALHSKTESLTAGQVAWRLVNVLALNHLGLMERAGGQGGRALQETMTLFADISDGPTERRIRGVRQVDATPVVRRVRHASGITVARGLEVRVLLEEKAFEGSVPFLLGAVLDRFFAEYVGLNSFTQTVVESTERGEIMRWPPRLGRRQPL